MGSGSRPSRPRRKRRYAAGRGAAVADPATAPLPPAEVPGCGGVADGRKRGSSVGGRWRSTATTEGQKKAGSRRKSQKAYSTRYSQAVSHPSTNQARPCLASEIRRDRARSGWYGRRRWRWPVPAPKGGPQPRPPDSRPHGQPARPPARPPAASLGRSSTLCPGTPRRRAAPCVGLSEPPVVAGGDDRVCSERSGSWDFLRPSALQPPPPPRDTCGSVAAPPARSPLAPSTQSRRGCPGTKGRPGPAGSFSHNAPTTVPCPAQGPGRRSPCCVPRWR